MWEEIPETECHLPFVSLYVYLDLAKIWQKDEHHQQQQQKPVILPHNQIYY